MKREKRQTAAMRLVLEQCADANLNLFLQLAMEVLVNRLGKRQRKRRSRSRK